MSRPRSPLAHGPDEDCPACRECPSCEGGSGVTPASYRLERSEAFPGALVVVCTRCDGTGVTCINFVKEGL